MTESPEPRSRLVAGCMTGTSLDGLDVALVEIEGRGLEMKATFRGMVSKPLAGLADALRHFAEGKPAPPLDYMKAARALGELHADAVEELCQKFNVQHAKQQSPRTPVRGSPGSLDFIVGHGQTIWHAPENKAEHQKSKKAENETDSEKPAITWAGGRHSSSTPNPELPAPNSSASPAPHSELRTPNFPSLSWQLFDPWPLVRRLGVPVCYDLRQADLIAGGQGAPITPLADWIMYREAPRPCVIANLGGICNTTVLQDAAQDTLGKDLGPCNILLDAVVHRLYPQLRFDTDGAIARRGTVVPMLHRAIFIDVVEIVRNRRTLGREQFPLEVIDGWLATAMKYETREDIVATYTAAVADLVASGMAGVVRDRSVKQVILAGGGARNPALVERIAAHEWLDSPVIRSDELGTPCEAREAMAFAVLGALSQDGVPITLAAVTGAENPGRAGAWVYP